MPELWGLHGSLENSGVRLLLAIVVALLLVAGGTIALLGAMGKLKPELRSELIKRTVAWAVMVPVVILPILFGKLPTTILVTILSLACYREFARATGLFRDKVMSVLVIIAIVALNFAALDNWADLFVALPALAFVAILAVAILRDNPKGYVQRIGLSTLSMLLFGLCLAHISFIANDPAYRGPMLLLLACVGLNDIYAFCVGKTFGGPKLAPNTSPGKTISGAVGAVVLTTLTVVLLGPRIFSTELAQTHHLIIIGLLLSVCGILGDLAISSVKRDVGIKDMGAIIPGHGGVLDRCNSLLLAAPAMFHYIGYVHHGFGTDQPVRILTGQH